MFRSVLFLSRGALEQLKHKTPHDLALLPIGNTLLSRPDVTLIDFEDGSYSQDAKADMRVLATEILKGRAFEKERLAIRVNSLEQKHELVRDLQVVLHEDVDYIMMPKLKGLSDLENMMDLLHPIEEVRGRKFKLLPIIETSAALFEAERIAHGSQQVAALTYGYVDAICQLGLEDVEISSEFDSSSISMQSGMIVTAAASAAIPAINGPFVRLRHFAGLQGFQTKSKSIGFQGGCAIHPSQVPILNHTFTPSRNTMRYVDRILGHPAASGALKPDGKGGAHVGDRFFGPPMKELGRHLKQRHDAARKQNSVPPAHVVKVRARTQPFDFRILLEPGQSVRGDHEMTLTSGVINQWQAAFYSASNVFEVSKGSGAGWERLAVPWSLQWSLALGLTVSKLSELALFHLGAYNAHRVTGLFEGDTVRAEYDVKGHAVTRSGNIVVETDHHLVSGDRKALTLTKRTMFAPCEDKELQGELVSSALLGDKVANLALAIGQDLPDMSERFVERARTMSPAISCGDLLLHRVVKKFTYTECAQLCNLLRVTNPHHTDAMRFRNIDLVVPGPFSATASTSAGALDIGLVLDEQWLEAINVNRVNPGDQLTSMTYVRDVRVHDADERLEEVTLQTIGVRNVLLQDLEELEYPAELFTGLHRPAYYENLCETHVPELMHNIACITTRKVLRVAPNAAI